MIRKILLLFIALIIINGCDYDIVEPITIKFRNTYDIGTGFANSRIISGHDNRYVIIGYTTESTSNGFITMIDGYGESISGFPVIDPSESVYYDFVKTDEGYAIVGAINDNNIYSFLQLTTKEGAVINNIPYSHLNSHLLLNSIIKTNNGFACSGWYINKAINDYDRFFIRTDDNGFVTQGPKIYALANNQLNLSMKSVGSGFMLAGWHVHGYPNNTWDIMLTFVDEYGNEQSNSPVYIGSERNDYFAGMASVANGYAILGNFENISGVFEWGLIFCDNNGYELNNIPKNLGAFSNVSNFSLIKIISTKDGGLAIIGYSSSKNIYLLLLDENGNQKSNSPVIFAHSGDQIVKDFFQTEDGGFVILGSTTENGDKQILVIKTDEYSLFE